MIKKPNEMKQEVKQAMRGGDGSAIITHLLNSEEYNGKARMIAKILLKPGCSIGYHQHENEEEIFHILSGEALYNDNGQEKVSHSGDSTVTLGGQSHSIANKGDKDVELVAIILTY